MEKLELLEQKFISLIKDYSIELSISRFPNSIIINDKLHNILFVKNYSTISVDYDLFLTKFIGVEYDYFKKFIIIMFAKYFNLLITNVEVMFSGTI